MRAIIHGQLGNVQGTIAYGFTTLILLHKLNLQLYSARSKLQ